MRDLFEICPKIQFFKLFWCLLRSEEGEFGQERRKIECSDVSGTTCKKSLFKPWENVHFSTFTPIFPPVPPKNLALPHTLKLLFKTV